jgi:hypothetical protein
MKRVDPTVFDFDELLGYLPVLYAKDFKPVVHWGGGNKTDKGVLVMPWPDYENVVREFFRVTSKECWCDRDYTSKNISEVIRDPQRVACATLQEIKFMLTWCVRGERFCDGHWINVINNGAILNVLLRLRDLRPQ